MGIRLAPIDADCARRRYDLVLLALGFESRSVHVAKTLGLEGLRRIAFGFEDRQVLAYEDNASWFRRMHYEVDVTSDSLVRHDIDRAVDATVTASEGDEIAVCVDISCFSRLRLAYVVKSLADHSRRRKIRAHFFYSLAEFSRPSDGTDENLYAGPVIPEFAGWHPDPDLPPIAIVGLGYEQGKALGAVEYLQADEVWAFEPTSPIPAYRDELLKANELFLNAYSSPTILTYDVLDPVTLYGNMESLIRTIARSGRPHVLPFGPKLFSLVTFLLACDNRQVSAWRVSAGALEPPVDRRPSTTIVGLEVVFGASS